MLVRWILERKRNRRVIALRLVAPLLSLAACGGDTIQGPEGGSLGSIRVAVQTTAATAEAALDSDGYVLFIAGLGTHLVESNGEVTLTDVPPGEHVVRLEELQGNCTTPVNPVRATVPAGGTAQVSFQVTCWPPTTGRIVFSSNRDSLPQLYTMNADGTDVVRLTPLDPLTGDPFIQLGFWPAWSPDGWRIAFSQGGTVKVINADGTGLTVVTSGEVASWSPDGSRLAFARGAGGEDIYVVDADGGGNEVRLTSGPAQDLQSAWSPDGSKIAFSTNRDGNFEVYVMNADGSDLVNLTNNLAVDRIQAGAWSPDGTRIVFDTDRQGDVELYIMNADGSDPVNLTNSPFDELGGSWSADGTKVVFSRHPVGNIFVMNADGTGVVDLTRSGAVLDRYPHWSRGTGVVGLKAPGAPRPDPAGSR